MFTSHILKNAHGPPVPPTPKGQVIKVEQTSSVPLHAHLLCCECERGAEHMPSPRAGSALHRGAAHHSQQHSSVSRHTFHKTWPVKAN